MLLKGISTISVIHHAVLLCFLFIFLDAFSYSPYPSLKALKHVKHSSIYNHKVDVIITYAVGIDFLGCYRFMYTARLHMPTIDILLFTNNATVNGSAELREAMAMFRVTPIFIDTLDIPEKMQQGNQHMQIRWLAYHVWMLSYEEKISQGFASPYDTVLFIDTRDTLFQGDVFKGLRDYNEGKTAFYAFLEAHDTIGGSEWNYLWIANCLGVEKLSVVADFPVACAGTIAASWSDALVYTTFFR